MGLLESAFSGKQLEAGDGFIAVLILSVYHTVISLTNLTTNEHVKNYYRENPFDFGPANNCFQIYCAPERVLPVGDDIIELDWKAFGSYSDGLSCDSYGQG